MEPIENLRKVRLEKLEKIRKLGINPYPNKFGKTDISVARNKPLNENVKIAGRVTSFRGHGKLVFADIVDQSGKIQSLFKFDILGEEKIKLLELLDVGDFIGVEGKLFNTQAGELTVEVASYTLLTKSLRPLPSTWYGFKDIEERYRKRYLDLIMNPEVKKVFEMRSKIIDAHRRFLIGRGYFEVETPVLQPLYGGGLAHPFKTYLNALGLPLYMRISTELYLKRLIVGGFEKVFEVNKVFRNEGMDKQHNPEFTLLETMEAYISYEENMKLIEDMTEYVVKEVTGSTKVIFQGQEIDFKAPWKRITMIDAVKQETGIDFQKITDLKEAQEIAKKLNVELDSYKESAVGLILAAIFEDKAEKKLIQPTFIYKFPVETSPLAKKCSDDPRFVERMEHYVAGMESSNNYSELNDPLDLSQRFKDERKKERLGDEEAHQTDDDFIEAMEYGMPPTSGIGPAIDRLVMVVTNQPTIRDVILFPTMKPEGFKVEDEFHSEGSLPEIKNIEQEIPSSLGITRTRALDLLKKYLKEESELNHLYATEIAMGFYAKKFGGNEDAWKLAGLLHDLDWDFINEDMEKHGKAAAEILTKEGLCQPVVYAILAHVGFPEYPRKTKMDSALWGSEELTGLILALAKGRPDKQVKNITKDTVLRAYKKPNFAAGVSRKVIKQGAEELGITLEEHINNVLEAMKAIEYEL